MDTYWIIFLVVVAICFILYLINRIWGVNILTYVVQSRPILSAVCSVLEAVAGVLPSKQLANILLI